MAKPTKEPKPTEEPKPTNEPFVWLLSGVASVLLAISGLFWTSYPSVTVYFICAASLLYAYGFWVHHQNGHPHRNQILILMIGAVVVATIFFAIRPVGHAQGSNASDSPKVPADPQTSQRHIPEQPARQPLAPITVNGDNNQVVTGDNNEFNGTDHKSKNQKVGKKP